MGELLLDKEYRNNLVFSISVMLFCSGYVCTIRKYSICAVINGISNFSSDKFDNIIMTVGVCTTHKSENY